MGFSTLKPSLQILLLAFIIGCCCAMPDNELKTVKMKSKEDVLAEELHFKAHVDPRTKNLLNKMNQLTLNNNKIFIMSINPINGTKHKHKFELEVLPLNNNTIKTIKWPNSKSKNISSFLP